MALQNNYKVVVTHHSTSTHVVTSTAVGRARDMGEVIERVHEKFDSRLPCLSKGRCKIHSIEYLGWETF